MIDTETCRCDDWCPVPCIFDLIERLHWVACKNSEILDVGVYFSGGAQTKDRYLVSLEFQQNVVHSSMCMRGQKHTLLLGCQSADDMSNGCCFSSTGHSKNKCVVLSTHD